MSEHQKAMTFSKPFILCDDGVERCQLEKSVARVQSHKRFMERLASVMALFTVLALIGIGWMVVFAGLLVGYPKKLKRLQNASQSVTRRQESHLDKADITTLAGSYRGPEDRESFQRPAEVSADHGSLDSPSWFSNRLCG